MGSDPEQIRKMAEYLKAKGMKKQRGVQCLGRHFPAAEKRDLLEAWGHIPLPGLWSEPRNMIFGAFGQYGAPNREYDPNENEYIPWIDGKKR